MQYLEKAVEIAREAGALLAGYYERRVAFESKGEFDLVTEADRQHWDAVQIVPFLDVAFQCFGPDRLMIGSDWPVCLLAASYARAIEVVKSYLLQKTPERQDRVLGGNAQRFWRLEAG